MRVVLLRVRGNAPANEPLLPHSALFNSAGTINSKPKTRFRSVFGCSGKTSGNACEREEKGKLSVSSSRRTHVGLQKIGEETFPIMEKGRSGRLMLMICF